MYEHIGMLLHQSDCSSKVNCVLPHHSLLLTAFDSRHCIARICTRQLSSRRWCLPSNCCCPRIVAAASDWRNTEHFKDRTACSIYHWWLALELSFHALFSLTFTPRSLTLKKKASFCGLKVHTLKKFAAAHSRASIDFLYTYLDERDAVDYTKRYLGLAIETTNCK